ncbi:site-specific DNA-methyltransferase [Mucilaginibacter ginsenosidivorax]|uniref:site-specific DNA-methyltransferase (adenine-specific) n=1 Tax=Mucilaginibacter ginsenosidivorax TaxID=862126 RepID=A0A5B8W5V1_9SPHI|nr:site-specific DNA-methyltransferase [Mucilaginibacter ginsenosidivorax]QEC79244.1 site-specific DNA-methyltransferase [Mucilaginibacter ginsenosidivorax]
MPTLTWIGKEKVITHHHDVPFKVLAHQYTFNTSAPPDLGEPSNKIIHGDNLEALKSLLPEYEGRVKCIYIDPPYNTGNESWVYNDNVNHPKLKKWLGQVVGKDSEDLTRHDKWLCMMYPRLVLLHKLLAKDGVIFISIDDNEQAVLKLICDEIFGGGNFVNNIIWQRAYAPVNTKKRFSPNHDFIICYGKDINALTFLLKRTDEANERYINPDNDKRGLYKPGDLSVGPIVEKQIYPITTPSGRIVYPPKGYCWRYTESRFQDLIADNRIWFGPDGNNVPAIKRFISEVKDGITPMTVWTYKEVGHTQDAKKDIKTIFSENELLFETPKAIKLMERIIQLATSSNSIILDSFAGSGTTAHAVLNLNKKDGGNRKFILIEMEDYAESITAERVKRVMQGYGGKEGTGGSFDYYILGEPLFVGENREYLNEAVGIDKIKNYVWYSETRTALDKFTPGAADDTLLGVHHNTAYYFIYHPERLTSLDFDSLVGINVQAGQYIVYADNCLLSKDFLFRHNIVFKKIPRDLSRF